MEILLQRKVTIYENIFPLIKFSESSPRLLASIFIYFPYVVIHSKKEKQL